jgi:hypothetical protein
MTDVVTPERLTVRFGDMLARADECRERLASHAEDLARIAGSDFPGLDRDGDLGLVRQGLWFAAACLSLDAQADMMGRLLLRAWWPVVGFLAERGICLAGGIDDR